MFCLQQAQAEERVVSHAELVEAPMLFLNRSLAIVGLTVINSTFVLLLGIYANVGQTFFKCPTIANT
jgi:hypothetical protein